MSRKAEVDEKSKEFDEFTRGFVKPIAGGIAGLIIGAIAGGEEGAVVGGLIGCFGVFLIMLLCARES